MPLILNIDTAVTSASVCLAEGDSVVGFAENHVEKHHATWLPLAIKDVMKNAGVRLTALKAVSVSNGPGSYTGLRIGLSAAKGLCYTLGIPLICLNTLSIMALAAVDMAEDLICPMIDARRMEVYTAIYDKQLQIIKQPEATILTSHSYSAILQKRKVLFTGNGMLKFKTIAPFANATFANPKVDALNMAGLSFQKLQKQQFEDVAYTEPFYIKAAYTT